MKLHGVAAIVAILSFVTLSLGTVTAATPSIWNFNVYEPANTITGRTLSLEYHILSTKPSDSFTVSLTQNGTFTESQTITSPYGGNGGFDITVPATGDYSFVVTAENQSTETASHTRNVTFVDPTPGATTTVYQNVGSTPNNATSIVDTPQNTTGGVVGDAAATTTKSAGNALGAQNNNANVPKDTKSLQENPWAWVGIGAALAALGGGAYWFTQRRKISNK